MDVPSNKAARGKKLNASKIIKKYSLDKEHKSNIDDDRERLQQEVVDSEGRLLVAYKNKLTSARSVKRTNLLAAVILFVVQGLSAWLIITNILDKDGSIFNVALVGIAFSLSLFLGCKFLLGQFKRYRLREIDAMKNIKRLGGFDL